MKKEIFIHMGARAELLEFPEAVREEFEGFFILLAEKGRLSFPNARKIGKDLFEIRIKKRGEYRGIYAYSLKNLIIILHFFRKKTIKTPLSSIKLAQKRIKDYE